MLLAKSAPEGETDEINAKADIKTTQEPRRKLKFCQEFTGFQSQIFNRFLAHDRLCVVLISGWKWNAANEGRPNPMPAYWFSSANVTDEAALADYAKLARPAIEKHGGRYLARGGRHVRLEGADFERHVIIEFPSLEAAEACYRSPEYQEALAFAKKAVQRNACIVEGL